MSSSALMCRHKCSTRRYGFTTTFTWFCRGRVTHEEYTALAND